MCWISSKGFTYLYGTQSSVSTCVCVSVDPFLFGENWTWFFRTEWPTFNMPDLSKRSSGGNGPASAPWVILNVIFLYFQIVGLFYCFVLFFLGYNTTVWLLHGFTDNVTYPPTKANKSRLKWSGTSFFTVIVCNSFSLFLFNNSLAHLTKCNFSLLSEECGVGSLWSSLNILTIHDGSYLLLTHPYVLQSKEPVEFLRLFCCTNVWPCVFLNGEPHRSIRWSDMLI